MPLWRDPLDELIADIEQTLPAAADDPVGPTLAEAQEQFLAMQYLVSRVLYEPAGTDFEMDPLFRDAREKVRAAWPAFGRSSAADDSR